MILLIDNYDSFVHNLARYVERLGHSTQVVRNDAITTEEVLRLAPSAIILSPGPCTPREAGCSVEVVRRAGDTPLLGVCLGHQAIAAAFDVPVVRAAEPRHGRTSQVWHGGDGVFAGLPSPMAVCRYHSLVVRRADLPVELRATAQTEDGTLMGIQHADRPLFGVQFHPEAVLTEHGYELLANFLRLSGLSVTADPSKLATDEDRSPLLPRFSAPPNPVTF